MAVARINDLRALPKDELEKKLASYEREMMESGDNPKKAGNLRKAIARIKTIMNEAQKPTRAGTHPESHKTHKKDYATQGVEKR